MFKYISKLTRSYAWNNICSRATEYYLLKLLKETENERPKNKEETKCFVRNDDTLRWIYSQIM